MTRYDTAVLADSPLLYWPLATDANDTSGNARHGTVNGTWNFNQANATFPGVTGSTAGSNSYIVSPSIVFPTGAITIEMIVDADLSSTMLWSIGANVIDLWTNGGMQWNGPGMAGSIATSPANGKHHLVFVFTQGGANTTGTKMYVDGVLAAQTGLGGTAPTLGTQTTRLSGWSYDAGYRYAAGKYVSNYAVYAGELSAARINAHYIETGYPPISDAFAAARTAVTSARSIVQDTTAFTTEASEPLGNGPAANTGWITFVPNQSGPVQVDTIGSAIDTALAIYTGSSLGALTLLAADDNSGGGTAARIRQLFQAGTTYYVQVGGANGATGGSVTVTFSALPVFSDAFALAGYVSPGSNVLTGSASNPNSGTLLTLASTLAEQIITGCDLTITPAGTISINWDLQLSENAGGQGKTVTYRLRRTGLTGAILATVNKSATIDSSAGNDSGFAWSSSYSDTAPTDGHYVLTVQNTGVQTIPYMARSVFTLSGTAGQSTVGFTTETGEPLTMPIAATGWCQFVPTLSGTYQIDTIGSNFDTGLAVYTGNALNTLVLLASDNDSGGSSTSKVTVHATAGQVQRIQVGSGSGTATGTVVLNITQLTLDGALISNLGLGAGQSAGGWLYKGRSSHNQDALTGG